MPDQNPISPGVYIEEISYNAQSVVPVPTAVPAFIGYTPKASYNGVSFFNKAIKISSFAEFEAFYCLENPKPPEPPAKQYNPQYYIVPRKQGVQYPNKISLYGEDFALVPDPDTIYYLYNSIRLFYLNGGGDAYIVSIGTYGTPSNKLPEPGKPLLNQHVLLNDLLAGIQLLKKVAEPTMYICPEATLLSVTDNGTLMQAMLQQNQEMKTAISIFDIIGSKNPDPILYSDDIQTFRNNTGTNGLSYGAAYYPFVGTTILQKNDLDYTNLFGGKTDELKALLSPKTSPVQDLEKIFDKINTPGSKANTQMYHEALLSVSPEYKNIIDLMLHDANLLPPSGGMAGVITTVDNTRGVWKAPANVSMAGVSSIPINLNSSQQETLNVDVLSGKSINAIRSFPGLGILVWGARTLDGNSLDWRYVPVRRSLIFIEQSCKLATQQFVFEPNEPNTWQSVTTMIEDFLTNFWKQGGLMGAKPSDAFSVRCGLGLTMTAQDITDGNLNISISVALVRPAEFIIISISHKMMAS